MTRLTTIVFAGALAAGCDVHTPPTEPALLASIEVTPDVTLAINATQQFVAVGRDAAGAVIPISPVWSIVAGGGTIASAGLFTAGALPGAFGGTVQAASDGISGTASVVVTAGALATITVTPDPVTLPIGGVQQFTAVGKDAGGNVVPISPVWAVVGGGGAIDDAALFTAGAVSGTFTNTVQATSGDISGTATVSVTAFALATIAVTPASVTLPINGTQQYSAVGTDAGGNAVSISPAWSVVAGGGAITVGGVFTAGTVPGTFANTVQATSGSISGRATVGVIAGALATIEVSPALVTLAINATQQYTAVGKDAGGNVVSIVPAWSVEAGGGAITGTALFTAGTLAGTFAGTVQAASGSITGTASVTVTAGALATITVTPASTTLAINGTQQYTAVGRDANGNVVSIVPAWSVVAGGGAIDGSALFTAAVVAGTFVNTVQATSGSITGTASVTVTAGALATIAVTPASVTLAINGTQQYTAVGRDAGGNVVSIVPVWSVVAGGGAIDGSALFTAASVAGTFANTVQAASGSITGTASLTVTAGALATLTVAPDPVTLAINGTQQYTATGHDAGGNVVPVSPAWSVVAAGGSISGTGLFTAGTTAGTYTNTVQAISATIVGRATVNVIAGPLATITVTPNPDTLLGGATQQFTAVGQDAGGNTLAITPVWSVVASGGTIGVTGLFTAGPLAGTFTGTVEAKSGTVSGHATVVVIDPPALVDLGAAATHGILGATTVTCVGPGSVGGDVGVAPGTSITGFPGVCTLTGSLHSGDAYAQSAHASVAAAYDQLSMPCDSATSNELAGQTLRPGLSCTGAATLSGELFLDAVDDPNATFVITTASTLTTAALSRVTLLRGAQARNVYWRIGSSATLGAGTELKGNLIAFTSITVGANVTLIGRLLVVNAAVTLGADDVITLP